MWIGCPAAVCVVAYTEIDGNDNHYWVWKAYAAFAPCSGSRLKAMDFGVTYDESVILLDHGNCLGDPNNGAAELPGPGWPASGTGTVLVWQYTQTTPWPGRIGLPPSWRAELINSYIAPRAAIRPWPRFAIKYNSPRLAPQDHLPRRPRASWRLIGGLDRWNPPSISGK